MHLDNNEAMDSLILESLKRTAAGLPRKQGGQPVSELDRLLAQGALTSKVAWPRGGISLFALVNGLHAEAMFDSTLSVTLGGMLPSAEDSYFSTVMTDIVSGRLIVREPLNFLRCNSVPEIQSLAGARQGLESMAILVRFAVKLSEAREWLDWHGVEMPDWLEGAIRVGEVRADQPAAVNTSERQPRWSDRLGKSKVKLRHQFDIIESEMAAKGYPALAVPRGGVADLGRICKEDHPDYFDSDSSFKNAWKELNRLGLVRVVNYDRHLGNPGGLNKSL